MLARTVLILAVLPTAIFCQRQQAASTDYEYADDPVTLAAPPKQTTIRLVAGSGAQAQQPAPVERQGAQAAQLGHNEPKEVRPEPVQILQQINEHNEDGSYTYGYEGSDGSFKLETRFPDGRVQGRYGYVDIESGKLKVIEYGADFMGFQPVGDLPEGIVVPPPVFNNDTIDGEENFESGQFIENSRLTVQNRARQGPQQSLQGNPSQNRGQDFQQPPPPPNREAPTRTPQLVVEQPFEEATPQQVQHFQAASFEPAGSRFEPTGAAPARPVQHAVPQPQPALAAQFQAAPAQPAPERPRAQPAPQSFIQPLPQQGSSSFSQEVNFEGRPTAAQLQASSQSPFPSNAVPSNAVPANAVPASAVPASAVPASAAPANFQSSSEFRSRPAQPAFEQAPQIQGVAPPSSRQPQGPFTSFPVNGGAPARPQSVPSIEQGGFEPIGHPEAERSAANSFIPSEEQNNQEQEAPAAPQFNPNRARTNVRAQTANRPISAAPTRPVARPAQPQPEQFAQPAQQAFQAQPTPPAQPAPQPARQLPQPVRQAPQPQAAAPTQASRQHLPRAQHITEGQPQQQPQPQQQQSFNNDNEEASTQPQPPSPGGPPKFASFPIVQEGARPTRTQSQPAAFEQQVVRESFRPEEEPQAAPVRIRPRPQEAAPQQFEAQPQLDQFQSFQAQSQQAQHFQAQSQQAQHFQAQPQQAQHFQAQPQQAQHFQAQPQQAQHFQAQPQQAQHFQAQPQQAAAQPQQFQQQQNAPSAINFDNLVQEFSAQNRAGRSREGFTTQTFKFNPVPAVPDV